MASPDDDLEYLSPSFDPASLTMPRLRNILMSHDIAYPASAKKPLLVDIFTQELKPKARKILAARDRVRRTSRGITDMPSSQEGTVNSDHDDDAASMPPPLVPDTPRQRRSRKTERLSAESTQELPASSRTPNGRRNASKHARQSDTDTDRDLENKRPSVRESLKSEATPKVKTEQPEDAPVRPPMRGGVFSDENPFQSGSSPSAPGEHRRRSAATSSEKRKNSSHRRRTESIPSSALKQEDGIVVPTSKIFEVPLSRLNQPAIKKEPEDEMEAGEGFTPEEQLDLVRERAAKGETDILPPRRKKRSKKSAIPKSAPWVVLMALMGGYGTWWRQEKLAVGYCGIGRPSNAISNVQIPEWASALHPTCEPCPQHAICYQNMETRCENDFVLQPHPLSLGGLVPLPPTCEPDGEKVRRVKTVADRAVEELRERKAQAECGTLKDNKGKDIPAEIDEQDLKKEVSKKRRRGMSEAEFEDLWKGAIGEIMGREEVVSSSDG